MSNHNNNEHTPLLSSSSSSSTSSLTPSIIPTTTILLPCTCPQSTDNISTSTSSFTSSIHHHNHSSSIATRKLWIASIICLCFFIIELIGGIISNSLAILSDSFHLLSDLSGFIISLFSIYLARQKATKKHSWGFHRAETIGALISILLIWIVTAFLIYEAIDRLYNPRDINGPIMFGIAILGLVVNLILIFALGHGHEHHHHHHHSDEEQIHNDSHQHHHHNINLKAAIIHIIGDVVQSIGVLISSVIIIIRPDWVIVDPICTFLFSAIVMFTTFSLTRDALSVLMEGTPAHIDPHSVECDLISIPNVLAVHDLHIWTLSVGQWAMACHIVVSNNVLIHEYDAILLASQALICSKYGVHHTTFQLEASKDQLGAHCKSSLCNGGVCDGTTVLLPSSSSPTPPCPRHSSGLD